MKKQWGNYRRLPMKVSIPTWPYVASGPLEAAEQLMQQLGFTKVEHAIVYEGPVGKLVAGLKRLGWQKKGGHDNPFLLIHPYTCMMFNYAANERSASTRYVSLFSAY